MHSRSRWARSRVRWTPVSTASGNSRILSDAISIRPGIGRSRCFAPWPFAAKRPAPICSRAASQRSITSRAGFSDISKACRKRRAAGAVNALYSMTASHSAMDCRSVRWRIIPMSDAKTLSERIDALETRLTFQDETVETLNKTITEQWRKIDALARQVAHLNERLVEAETRTPGAANEPPPHY